MDAGSGYMPPKRKSNTGLIIGLVIAGLLLCCVVPISLIGGGGLWVFSRTRGTIECFVGMTEAHRSLLAFAKANEGRLPEAAKWQDQIQPFFEKEIQKEANRGPIRPWEPGAAWGCKLEDGSMTGFAFNSDLSGKNLADIKDHLKTIAMFEIEKPSRNAHAPYEKREGGPVFVMGQRRSWAEVTLSGEIKMEDSLGNPIDFGSAVEGSSPGDIQTN